MRKIILLLFLCQSQLLWAQINPDLPFIEGKKIKVFYSIDAEEKAKKVAARCENVLQYYQKHLGFEPSVSVLVLNPADWKKYAPGFYGMPSYSNKAKTLYVASEDNNFWKSFIPLVDKAPQNLKSELQKTYNDGKGGLTMKPFFDLLAIHELGHAYHNQAGLKMQRQWFAETFSNILLHTYIAENEPQTLPSLTLFPQLIISDKSQKFKYTTLSDLENNYDDLGRNHPQNYGWYQCRWHAAAAEVYDTGGLKLFKKLWSGLKAQKEILDDQQLAIFLKEKAGQPMADVMLKWDNFNH